MRGLVLSILVLITVQTSFASKIVLYKNDFSYSERTVENNNTSKEGIFIDFSSQKPLIDNLNRYSFITEKISNENLAKFFSKEHGISLVSSQNLLGISTISSLFSLYLSFYPIRIDDGTVIARIYSIDEISKGISVKIEKSSIKVELNGIVKTEEGENIEVVLTSDDKIKPREFYEISLVIDVINSKISLYINGVESDRRIIKQASFDLSSKEGIMEFFTEFVGYAKSIAISPVFIRSLAKRNQEVEYMISKIIDTKNFSTRIEKIVLNGKGNFIVLSRVSSTINELLKNTIQWKPLEEVKQTKGRYIQFKIIPIRSDESVEFQSFEVHTKEDIPPQKPVILYVESRNEGEITVNWENDLDEDIEYYEIFYGEYENKYFGKEALNGPSPIRVKKPLKFYPVLSYTIKGLDNRKMYYISIRSVRKDNTKSDYSDEFKTIPSKSISRY
ncbi:MAG: fibronectin type III domain-containing protein [Brevinematia bacterium]